jgi:Holliday junction DNA helicase RuvA
MGAFARISMIGWLQGRLSETWQQGGRCGLLLICQGVGYELQLSQRHWQRLPAPGAELSLHVHHSIRDDGWTLFGFADRIERDLFRELLAVSGVGPQAALGLLGALEPRELVSAVVRSDLRRLCQAPGVGKRTAERLAVELRQRFRERFVALVDGADISSDGDELPGEALPDAVGADEVGITLAALGYEALEIHRALRAVAATGLASDAPVDSWIRECLRWLSRAAA